MGDRRAFFDHPLVAWRTTACQASTGGRRYTATNSSCRDRRNDAQDRRGRHPSHFSDTIYEGQGRTLDDTYLYHTHHRRSAASYVALTRRRASAQVFMVLETARDAPQLARQMAREEIKAASVAWASRDELTPAMGSARPTTNRWSWRRTGRPKRRMVRARHRGCRQKLHLRSPARQNARYRRS